MQALTRPLTLPYLEGEIPIEEGLISQPQGSLLGLIGLPVNRQGVIEIAVYPGPLGKQPRLTCLDSNKKQQPKHGSILGRDQISSAHTGSCEQVGHKNWNHQPHLPQSWLCLCHLVYVAHCPKTPHEHFSWNFAPWWLTSLCTTSPDMPFSPKCHCATGSVVHPDPSTPQI